MSYSLERDERKHYQEVIRCLDIEQKKNASLTIENEINRLAAENANRKINDLNSRVVEFELIKKEHLKTIEQLRKT